MARFKNFNHGPGNTRHGEKISHIRPFNWNHAILGSQRFPKTSSPGSFFRVGKRHASTGDQQATSLDPVLSNKTFLLNSWFSQLKSSCSYFL